MMNNYKKVNLPDINEVEFHEENDQLVISHSGVSIPIFLGVSAFKLDKKLSDYKCEIISKKGDIFSDVGKEIDFAPILLKESGIMRFKIILKWFTGENLLRKYVKYSFENINEPVLVQEIVIDEIELTDTLKLMGEVVPNEKSYPVLLDGFFLGIEYPAATTRSKKNSVKISHAPGIRAVGGEWYESRKMVCGIAPLGEVENEYLKYISANSFENNKLHINYNSWWSMPAPYTEDDVVKLMNIFKDNLIKNETRFDSFSIDAGWTNPKTIWEINKEMFPNEFNKLYSVAKEMGSDLGLWVSPSACYPFALDNDWSREQGYETFKIPWYTQTLHNSCLGGEKYIDAFKNSLIEIVKKFNIKHVKLDGAFMECSEEGHGHEPGPLSTEKMVEGFISVLAALRKAMPDIWMEATCFGFNPSPWWLFYVNSVLGTYGDDSQFGRVPCPIYRESYTSSRDFFNLQGIGRIKIPIRNQELLGFIHQTDDDFTNDLIVTLLRGHMFLPAYVNPIYMNDNRWRKMAEIFNWGRKNEKALFHTKVFFPESWKSSNRPMMTNEAIMPREPYGYAHWSENPGIVLLRNPWITQTNFELEIPYDLTDSDDSVNIISIYPEVRTYKINVKKGEICSIPLLPYETIVLSIEENCGEKYSEFEPTNEIHVLECNHQIVSSASGDILDNPIIKFTSKVDIKTEKAKLIFIMEANNSPFNAPEGAVQLNNKDYDITWTGTDDGWSATIREKVEHWILGVVELEQGENSIIMEVKSRNLLAKISCWIWGYKTERVDELIHENALPSPEMISVDSEKLFEILR